MRGPGCGGRTVQTNEGMTTKAKLLADSLRILIALGMPRAQHNERSAVSLLALLDLRPGMVWSQATNPLIGITPIMSWARQHYDRDDAPNTRETYRRQTMHQLVDAGIALYNPDDPTRAVNSPRAVYQISPPALELIKTYRAAGWKSSLSEYLKVAQTLAARYAAAREHHQIPVTTSAGNTLTLTPGDHSRLIKAIIKILRRDSRQAASLCTLATQDRRSATLIRHCSRISV